MHCGIRRAIKVYGVWRWFCTRQFNEHFTFLIAIISRKRSVVNADRPEGKNSKIKEPHPQQTSLINLKIRFAPNCNLTITDCLKLKTQLAVKLSVLSSRQSKEMRPQNPNIPQKTLRVSYIRDCLSKDYQNERHSLFINNYLYS